MATSPTFVAAGAFVASSNAILVGLPAGWAAGDLFVLMVETANEAVATPSGWTEAPNSPQMTGVAGAAGGTRLSVFYKIATSSEGSVTIADSGDHQCGIRFAFRGVDTATPFEGSAGNVLATADTAITMPSVITSSGRNSQLYLALIATDRDVTFTTNFSGWTSPNGNVTSIVEIADAGTPLGFGGGVGAAYGLAVSGESYLTVTQAVSSTAAMISLVINGIYQNITDGVSEAVTASDTQGASGPISASVTEAVTASDVVTVTSATNSTISETLAATDAASSSGNFVVSITELVGATDAIASTYTTTASVSETVTATDQLTASKVIDAVTVESVSATDSQSFVISAVSAFITEQVAASDASQCASVALGLMVENVSAADMSACAADIVASIGELVIATDTTAGQNVTFAYVTETGDAVEIVSSGIVKFADVVENAIASDTIVNFAVFVANADESAVAFDAVSGMANILTAKMFNVGRSVRMINIKFDNRMINIASNNRVFKCQ